MERGKHTEYELMLRKSIGGNLKQLIKEKHMTQKRLSDLTGIATSTLSDYFNGNSLAIPGNVEKMARALGVSKDKIDPSFGDADEPLILDPKMQFLEELERELGVNLADPNIQKMLKRAAKVLFSDED